MHALQTDLNSLCRNQLLRSFIFDRGSISSCLNSINESGGKDAKLGLQDSCHGKQQSLGIVMPAHVCPPLCKQ